MVTTSLMKILIFFEIFEILKFWKNFRVFLNRRWSPSVPNKYKSFIHSGRGTKNPQKRFTLPVHSLYILIDWVWGNNKFVVPETLTIDRGEAEVNSQGRGDNKLAIPEYTIYKYFIIPKNIRLIVEWSPQNDKDQ